MIKQKAILLCLIAVVAFSAGCANRKVERISHKWVESGKTTRESVKRTFGEPAAYYEDGRLLAYRINVRIEDSGSPFTRNRLVEKMEQNKIGETRYNLLFLFDEEGILREYARIDLQDS